MAVPAFLQSATYSTNTAATSHVIATSSPVRAYGGAICPSTLVLTISYDGVSGSQVSSITDSKGDTWQVGNDGTNDVRTSNGSGVNGEMWYCFNAKPGVHSLTVNLSSSVKVTMVLIEIDQVRPVSALDRCKGNINTTASTNRVGLSGTKRNGMIAVTVEGLAFNDATLTCTAVPAQYAGLVNIKDGSSNVGAAMAYTAAEKQNLTASQVSARFTMSAGTTPVALMTLSFYRDGVVTSTDEDGYIDDIEGVSTVSTSGERFLYTSSTSAPLGGTGSSERSTAYSFFPDYSANLLTGVTIDSSFTFFYSQGPSGGYDDGTGYMNAFLYVFKDGTFGSTLDSSDESWSGASASNEGVNPTVAGWHSVALATSTYFNTSGYTTSVMRFEGDTNGGFSSTYAYLGDNSVNTPDYLQLSLNYPAFVSGAPQMTLMGVGM